jgi:hypothetical protein
MADMFPLNLRKKSRPEVPHGGLKGREDHLAGYREQSFARSNDQEAPQ